MSIVKVKAKNGAGISFLVTVMYIGFCIIFGFVIFPTIMAHFGKEVTFVRYNLIAAGVGFIMLAYIRIIPVVSEIFHGLLGAGVGFVIAFEIQNMANDYFIEKNMSVWESTSPQAILIDALFIALMTYFFVKFSIIERRKYKEEKELENSLKNNCSTKKS